MQAVEPQLFEVSLLINHELSQLIPPPIEEQVLGQVAVQGPQGLALSQIQLFGRDWPPAGMQQVVGLQS